MKISVITIGCKVNQYESDSLIRALSKKGHQVTDGFEPSDVYIINTCAVTAEAERKSRQTVSRAKKFNKNAIIYIIGCAAERNAEQFSDKADVRYISGTAGKARLALFEQLEGISVMPIPNIYEDDFRPLSLRARNYVKVQDGCNNFCSYCILPYIRGRSRSRPLESIIDEVRESAESSNETVLTGINLSAYGQDIKSSLAELLSSIKGIVRRLRLGSLEVNVIESGLLDVLADMKEFCPHFHLSLQSGDDMILKDMNRHYSREEYYNKVNLIRRYFPQSAITTDVIVGFPTEDEEAFANTLEFIEKIDFAFVHAFPYSRREGTKAAKYRPLDRSIVSSRMKRIESLRDRLREEYNKKFIDKPLEVLIEDYEEKLYSGYSRNYIKIYSDKKAEIKGITTITPKEIYKDGLKG